MRNFSLLLLLAAVVISPRGKNKGRKIDDPSLSNLSHSQRANLVGQMVLKPKECYSETVKEAQSIVDSNLLFYMKGGNFNNWHITKCETQLTVGVKLMFFLDIIVDGKPCHIDVQRTASNNRNLRLYNLSTAKSQLEACRLLKESAPYQRSEIFGNRISTCKSQTTIETAKKNLGYAIGPHFNPDDFEVLDCSESVLNSKVVNLLLHNTKNDEKVLASIQMQAGVPNIVTVPEDFIARKIEEEVAPEVPEIKKSDSKPCPVSAYAKQLEQFLAQVATSTKSAADFFVQDCFSQDIDNGVASHLRIVDEDGFQVTLNTFTQNDGGATSIVVDPIEYTYYLAGIKSKEETQPLLKMMVGGWTPQTDCSSYVQKFGEHLGDKHAFDDLKVTDCFTQVVSGYNARFKLHTSAGEVVSVQIYQPAGIDAVAEFSVTPSDFVNRFKINSKKAEPCSDADKLAISEETPEIFAASGKIPRVIFIENFLDCIKEGNTITASFSFDGKTCDGVITGSGKSMSVVSGTCLKDVQMI